MNNKKYKGIEYQRLIQDHSPQKNVEKSNFVYSFSKLFQSKKKNASEKQEEDKAKCVENPCYSDEPLIQL